MHPSAPRAEKYEQIFAIGDIHGCSTELCLLLEKLPLNERSLVVFLGDYVDRGSGTRAVIDTILELKRRLPVVALRGNHEDMFEAFLEHPESAGAGLFVLNGGGATLASYQTAPGHWEIPDEHRRFLRELPYFFETERFFFVHAGVPNLPLSQISTAEHGEMMLWIRSAFLASQFRWEKTIVHGHTPVGAVDAHPNRINVDTGCVYDGRLSAIELISMKVYSVEKQTKAEEPTIFRDAQYPGRVATRFSGALRVEIDKNGKQFEFETLNYNQFGLLIRELPRDRIARFLTGSLLDVGEIVSGRIGPGGEGEMRFAGTVVRLDPRGEGILYGIKLHELQVPGDSL